MNINKPLNVLVYGATGSQAGAVPTRLLERGHQPYVLTRSTHKATHHAQAGAIIVEGDMADADRLRELSEGMDAVSLLIPFFANPAEVINYGRQAIDAAKAAGVKLLVWNTSGFILPVRTGNPSIDVRIDILDYLQGSRLPYVVLQPSAYLENLLGPWTAPFVANENRVAYPAPGDMPISWIASDDVSALVVAALERPELAGANWPISGLENPNGPALARAFSEGLGRPIDYYAMPPRDFGGILDQLFGPGAGAAAASEYQRMWDFPDQRPDFRADMQPVLDKLPVRMTSISEWVARHKAVFAAPVPV
ncbi:NAD-dependent epimerase/dehydratase family protein [Fibrisoma montanum]|uniref:NAD-dependent epimerase/dehydratase family protein n=1 Tax=Fibrisoma montanum TaxID=2305895 RepID=A0A418LZC7_9BACT|nr:NmrA family NAD(P)-binding protein [Fibrisoma montanum]RIV18690.1 NAD-dependent epimerase/dehydratase family protein [Fibrisoma montanum]